MKNICRLCGLDLTETTKGALWCVCCSPQIWTWAKLKEDGYCKHARAVRWLGKPLAAHPVTQDKLALDPGD